MSEVMNRTTFENLMDEYLRGELSPAMQNDYESYLELHPECQSELDDMRQFLSLMEDGAQQSPAAETADQAAAGLRKQLQRPKEKKTGWFRQPAFTWSFALSLVLVLGLTVWPSDSSFVYARLIESLKLVENLKVEGWVRGENGNLVPYKQWVVADGTLRAESGEGDQRRIVVLKGNNRLIKDADGKLYHDNTPVRWPEDLGDVLHHLQATYQSPDAAQSSFEYSKEDLGDVVRFQHRDYASLGKGPGNRKWVMEVDKNSALPTLVQVYQQIDERWVQISDLRFSLYNAPLDEELFRLAGTSSALTPKDKMRFWFELGISPGSVQLPAAYVPEGGLSCYWPTEAEMPEGISSGVSGDDAGGISTREYRFFNLGQIVSHLTGLHVVSNEISEDRISLVMSFKKVLPWKKSLAPVLDHLGLTYERVPRLKTQRRFIFGQDGRDIPTTLHKFENLAVHADSSGYKYSYVNIPLQRVASSLLVNCNWQGSYTQNDTIEFIWDGPSDENPFALDVDLECAFAQPTFDSNVAYLKEHFGLTMRVEEKQTKTMDILLVAR